MTLFLMNFIGRETKLLLLKTSIAKVYIHQDSTAIRVAVSDVWPAITK